MSAHAWLDNLPKGWKRKRADALLHYEKKPARTDEFGLIDVFHYSIPVVQETGDGAIEPGSEIDSDKIYLKGNELLVSKLNPQKGCVLLARPQPIPIVGSTEFVPLTPRPGFDRRFAFYVYSSEPVRELISAEVKSATRSHQRVNPEDITKIWLPVPPAPDQCAIADYLDRETTRIDALTAAKERWLELLEEKRKALIAHFVTKGLDQSVTYKDSGIEWLGEIPKHWTVRRVKYLFKLVVEPASIDNDFELLSLYTDIGVRPRKELEARGNKSTTTDNYWLVKRGDLIVNKLLAWMGAFGVSEYEGVTSPAYDVLRPIGQTASFYYHHLFRCGICLPEIRRRSYGIMDMRLRLYFDRLGDMPVPVPPYEEQVQISVAIANEVKRFDLIREATERSIALLRERRAVLIAEGVTGQLGEKICESVS